MKEYNIHLSGTYEFGGSAGGTFLDLGGVFALDLKRHLKSEAIYPNDLIDNRGLIDDLQDFDGTGSVDGDTIYTILEINEEWVKLKHPEIGGYFVFKRESIGRVICE